MGCRTDRWKDCQMDFRMDCQMGSQKDCWKDYRKDCRKGCRNDYQKDFRKDCRKNIHRCRDQIIIIPRNNKFVKSKDAWRKGRKTPILKDQTTCLKPHRRGDEEPHRRRCTM